MGLCPALAVSVDALLVKVNSGPGGLRTKLVLVILGWRAASPWYSADAV